MTTRHTRVPVITIGGFLGAGKTTLVNHLLAHADGRRFIVFVNDFGALNIDHTLIDTVAADRIALSNGCVCCSLNQDLVRSIADFARRSPAPDAFIIEASGVADPTALDSSIHALETAGLVRQDVRLHVLDCAAFEDLGFDDVEQLVDVAAASDMVLFNKVDLVAPSSLARLHCLLDEAAPFSTRLEVQHCRIDAAAMLGLSHARAVTNGGKATQPRGPVHADANHQRHYASASFTWERPLDQAHFEGMVPRLVGSCWRAKGLLRFAQSPTVIHAFHLVGRRITLEPVVLQEPPTESQLVLIGRAGQFDAENAERLLTESLGAPDNNARAPDQEPGRSAGIGLGRPRRTGARADH